MIFGDPYKFAILIKIIDQWSDDDFINGMFHFCIDGYFFPEEIRTSTLWVDVESLRNNALVTLPENKELFEKEKQAAFRDLLYMISPSLIDMEEPNDFESSYMYQASTENIDDAGSIVFAVCLGESVRILAAKYAELEKNNPDSFKWINIKHPAIKEVFISKHEINQITDQLFEYYDRFLCSISNKNDEVEAGMKHKKLDGDNIIS